jgi:hypothetical protein
VSPRSREGTALVLQVIQLALQFVLIGVLVWIVAEQRDARRTRRNLLWEVNRHSLIMYREGLATPADQLGLPDEIPTNPVRVEVRKK